MRRRAMMKGLGVAVAVGGAGCMGGGEVVEEVQRTVPIEPGRHWSRELPDVSEPGGSIEYVVRAERAFDVFFFTNGEDYATYREGLGGEDPGREPTGHDDLSATAVPVDAGHYEVTTESDARQSVDAEGPYYFVVDHTDYGTGARPTGVTGPLSVSIDLTLVRNRL